MLRQVGHRADPRPGDLRGIEAGGQLGEALRAELFGTIALVSSRRSLRALLVA